jgi:hypothetical protein
MMRREYIREPSRAANWAIQPAIFSLVLGLVATLAHRNGLLSSQNYVLVGVVIFAIAALGFTLSMFGLFALWTRGAKGGMRSTWALFMSLPVLGTGLLATLFATFTAPLSDISTDAVDPPSFTQKFEPAHGANINEPPRIDRLVQLEYYPYLTGRRYALATETIVPHVVKQIVEMGWTPAYENARLQGNGDWLMEARVNTSVFGFVDSVVFRITDEGTSTYVDMRSASNFGQYDLGANARRIESFLKALDVRVSQQTK